MIDATKSMTAVYLRAAIHSSGKTLREICAEVGLMKPNALSMMQLGTCKVPINRIPALATACGIQADEFIAIAMREYHPEIWSVLSTVVAQSLSASEGEWLGIFRALSLRHRVEVDTDLWLAVFLFASRILERRKA